MTTLPDRLFGAYLGMEFREDSVTVTYLRNTFSGLTLLSSSVFALRDDDGTVNEIREYMGGQGVNVRRVFVSIPDKWAITRFIQVPPVKGKGRAALADLMKFEIERHIPFRIEDVTYDFQFMDEVGGTGSAVFVALHKNRQDFVREFLEKLSLQPYSITISSFAVLNTIELSGVPVGGWQEVTGIVRKSDILGKKGETDICLYMDRAGAGLAILGNGLCMHLRHFDIDTRQPSDDLPDDICGYIARVRSDFRIESFNKLILAGEASSGYAEKITEKLRENNVPVESITDFRGRLRDTDITGLESSVGACLAGLGAGTYRINLLPHKRGYAITRIAPLTTKMFLVLILIMAAGIFTTEALKQKKYLAEMGEILKKNEPAVSALERISSDTALLKKRSAFLKNIKENEIALEILAELTAVLPKEAWITTLNYKGFDIRDPEKGGRELIISGFADSSSSLIPILEDSPFFEKVEFVGTIKKTRGKEQFKLKARIVRPDTESKS
ncbi:MAG: pilus assembly protein PilM [Deferribacteres bacterium]|nr:pilus assembly protein PilM [Deferribacteres bacterium]